MNDDTGLSEEGYGLVMPFVVCASQGGPYDDAAYVAGYEMGLLDQRLRTVQVLGLGSYSQPVPFHEGNRPQIDLLAMSHGFVVNFAAVGDGWVDAEFTVEARTS